MQLDPDVMKAVHTVIGMCLVEAKPGGSFTGRVWTDPIEGEGILGVLMHDGSDDGTDPRRMGLTHLAGAASTLDAGFVVTDATLSNAEGESREAAVIDLFVRGHPTGYTLVQFYEWDEETTSARPQGNLGMLAQCEQLLG